MSRDNDWLNDVMEIDHVIRVNPDGTVDKNPRRTHPGTPYAPEACIEADHDNQISAADEKAWTDRLESQGWSPERGWTGQDRYHGPLMHPSEYVGGALAEHVLETPGLWVCVAVDCLRGDLTESTCQSCGARIHRGKNDLWSDLTAGAADSPQAWFCPESDTDQHEPDHDPEECGCARDEQESENAGWAILHMDDGPETDSYVMTRHEGEITRAVVSDLTPRDLGSARKMVHVSGVMGKQYTVPGARIIRVTDLAVMPNEDPES